MRKRVLARLLLAAAVALVVTACASRTPATPMLAEPAGADAAPAPPRDAPAPQPDVAAVTETTKSVAMPTTSATAIPVDGLASALGGNDKGGVALGSTGLGGIVDNKRAEAGEGRGPGVADSGLRAQMFSLEKAKEATTRAPPEAPPPPPPPAESQAARGDLGRPVDDRDGDEGDEGDEGRFAQTGVNPLVDPREDRFSTFAIDVDTGSFTLARRFLEQGSTPSPDGVRVEEWVNAFHYSYPGPESTGHPFTIDMEGAPLAKQSMVLRVGIQGKRIAKAHRDPVHLVFLVDVSGSMSSQDRLPLAKRALDLLVDELGERDSVGLVTYAGATQVVLPATPVTRGNRARIKDAITSLRNGGGTNMGSGMELAYREANKALGDKGIARVIVLSDGDANIGRVSHAEMLKSVHGYVSEGVTLSTIGFGTGNYRDDTMEGLADAGNGNYSYVGSLKDAKKVFVDDLTGTLQVIAKDTKIQVEMNPDVVKSYRLIGYENRDIADRDFRNDKVDAGEIGAGHTVTALYEVIFKEDDPSGDIATVRVRYKAPKGDEATEVAQAFPASSLLRDIHEMSVDGRFAVGVGLAAEVFRHSAHMDRLGMTLADAERIMESASTGPFASERKDFTRLLAPLARGADVARR